MPKNRLNYALKDGRRIHLQPLGKVPMYRAWLDDGEKCVYLGVVQQRRERPRHGQPRHHTTTTRPYYWMFVSDRSEYPHATLRGAVLRRYVDIINGFIRRTPTLAPFN